MQQPRARLLLKLEYLTGQLRHALAVEAAPTRAVVGISHRLDRLRQGLVASLWPIARDRWLLAALAVSGVALALRIVGDTFGLPAHFHWDEPTIVNRAIRMGNGDLNPHFFYYPGLTFYLTFACEAALYLVGHLVHAYPSTTSYAAAYFTDSTPFYLVGRVVGGVLGAATCLLCFLLGRRVFSPVVGLLAACLLAVAPVAVANGHFITNDVPMSFFTVLAYLWIWRVYERDRWRDYALAGLAIGLGVATKYLPIVLVISLVLAHVLRIHREAGRWRPQRSDLAPLALAMVAMMLTFVVFSPFSVLDWRHALHDYVLQGQISSAAGSTRATLNFLPYLSAALPWSIGWPAYLTALGGLVAVIRAHGERRLQLLLFISFPILFFLMIGSARQPWARWLVTLQPFLALGAAAAVWWCARQAPGLWQRYLARVSLRAAWVRRGAFSALAVIVLLPPALASLRFDGFLLRTDSRTQAASWFTAHIPTTATITIQPLFDRYFLTAPIMTTGQLAQLDAEIPAGKPAVRETMDAYYHAHALYRDVPFVYDLAKLRAEGVHYVVLSSASTHNSGNNAAEDRFYAALRASGTVVARFRPADVPPDADQYPVSSPIITIYALPAVAGMSS